MKLKGLNHIFADYDHPWRIDRKPVIKENKYCSQLADIYLNVKEIFYDLDEMEIGFLGLRTLRNEEYSTYEPTFTRYLYEI